MKISVGSAQKATIHFVFVSGTHPYNEYIRISNDWWLRKTPTGHYEQVYDPQELELEFQHRQPETLYDIITARQNARKMEPDTHGHNEKPCPVCKDIICMARKTFEQTASNTTESSTKWPDKRATQKLMSFAKSIHALRMKQDRNSERKTT